MSFQTRGAFSQLCTIIQTFSYCSAKASSKPSLLPLFLFIKQLCWGWLRLVKFKEQSCQNYERGSRGERKCLSPHREWEKGKWQPLVQDAINNCFGTAAQETAWLAFSSLLLPHWVAFNPLQHLLREEVASAKDLSLGNHLHTMLVFTMSKKGKGPSLGQGSLAILYSYNKLWNSKCKIK